MACTIDETRHKANGKQTEGVICPQGLVLCLIVRSDHAKNITLASFAALRFKRSYWGVFNRGSDQEKAIKNPFAPFAP